MRLKLFLEAKEVAYTDLRKNKKMRKKFKNQKELEKWLDKMEGDIRVDAYLNEDIESNVEKYRQKVIDFFKKNPEPDDTEIHNFSEKLGIDPHEFEELIYSILGKKLKEGKKYPDELEGGLADKLSVEDIAKKHGVSVEHIQKQLNMGINIEMEHVNDKSKAREISLDHLEEDPNYYSKLKKMENEEEKQCPEGQQWCPIQKKCITPKRRGLKEYLEMNEMGSELNVAGLSISKKVMKKMKKKYKTLDVFMNHLETKAKSLKADLSDRDRQIIKAAFESI